MKEREAAKRMQAGLDAAIEKLEAVLRADDDLVISQSEIDVDDGGEMKNQSELQELRTEQARLCALRPGLLLKKESAELALQVSRLGTAESKEITLTMRPGTSAYVDPSGKKVDAIAPKLATMTVPTGEQPRVGASLAGTDNRGPEYHAAVRARKDLGDLDFQIADVKRRIEKGEREVANHKRIEENSEAA